MRPFRFLTDPDPTVKYDGPGLKAFAKRAEAIGYSAIVMPDHLIGQKYAPIPVLSTVAAVTETLRVSTFVFNNNLRHPAVLAQELATLDVLSGGRLEIGIGAGWNKPEHDAIGIPFDVVGARIDRLTEAIEVLKGCFADGDFSYEGKHYTITGYDAPPKPLQRPHPPIFIGGGGKRLLTLAAKHAQIIGLAPRITNGANGMPTLDAPTITLAATEEKIGWIRAAAGDRFDEIELNTYPSGSEVIITDDAEGETAKVAEAIRERTGVELTVEELQESPHTFIGTVDQLTEKIVWLRERLGISSFLLTDLEGCAPIVQALAGK